MIEQVSQKYEDFDDWFAALKGYADIISGRQVAKHIAKYPFMYEDYYEKGLDPVQAFRVEWVN